MDTNTHVVENDDTEMLLADLDLEITVESEEGVAVEALDDDAAQAIEVLNEQSEAIEGQTSTIEADASAAATPAKAKKERKAKEAKESKPKIERDLSAIGDEFFQLVKDVPADKAAVIATKPAQKKIAEKFDNLFASLAAGRKPSVYTMACFNVVAEKGEVTSSDLVAAMKATAARSGAAYSDGTARSQVGQLMALFDVVGIAKREGNKLTFNKDSKIAERLSA